MTYFLDQDGDGHWYIIPSNRRDDWLTWLETSEDEEMGWEEPDYVVRLGGHPNTVEFTDYEIQ